MEKEKEAEQFSTWHHVKASSLLIESGDDAGQKEGWD